MVLRRQTVGGMRKQKHRKTNCFPDSFHNGVLSFSNAADHVLVIAPLLTIRGLVITGISGPFESIARDAKVKLLDRIVAIEAWICRAMWVLGCRPLMSKTHICDYFYVLFYAFLVCHFQRKDVHHNFKIKSMSARGF